MAVASIAHAHDPVRATVGVDTHKDTHVGHAKDELGRDLGHLEVPTTARGYSALLAWARSHGEVVAFGVDGTSSYGMVASQGCCKSGDVSPRGRSILSGHLDG
jgi:transposase